ncbi:pilus assembly protein TadG-related protein [Streptomyces sp. NPDC056503]|uniref:pilus assembly protein TadG-related protein n=1 Tax=Streptomyces sp. NPDC056503 TaxID=3345842 RepID=UPI003684944F
MRCGGREVGQAFPAYIAVIAGLLFLALVYFAVGQAAVVRNGAQTAADAAALAAAQDARDQLREGWLEVIGDPSKWQPFVDGVVVIDVPLACQNASRLAVSNDAVVDDCQSVDFGFRVTVHTNDTVGESIVPDVASREARATAAAVLEPRCSFDPPEPPQESEPPQDSEPPSTPPEESEEQEAEPIVGLVCDGDPFEIDPDDPVLPGAGDIFRVRLTGNDE